MKKFISLINFEFITLVKAGFRKMSLAHPVESLKKIINYFSQDSLYRNSIYLMFSTFIMAFFGFFFWIINAHLYSPEQVGLATTLISVMTLIAGFSNLGFNIGLVRYLPITKNKNELINSSFMITSLTTLITSVVFILGLQIFSPKLLFLRENLAYAVLFIIFTIALSNGTIAESLFVAYRSTKYTFYKNALLSFIKLILPLTLLSFSTFGIFAAIGIANIIALLYSLYILAAYFKFDIHSIFNLNREQIRNVGSYSFGNYIANFVLNLPTMILPLIIINIIGAEETAYFYMAMMIANFIFTIPQATTQSLFAEGSHNMHDIKNQIYKTTKVTALLLLPAILFIILFGKYILFVFGKSYSYEGFILLQLLSLSSIFIALNSILGTILKVNSKIKNLIVISVLNTLIILSLSYLFIDSKLYGLGMAWILGQAISSAIYVLYLMNYKLFSISPWNNRNFI